MSKKHLTPPQELSTDLQDAINASPQDVVKVKGYTIVPLRPSEVEENATVTNYAIFSESDYAGEGTDGITYKALVYSTDYQLVATNRAIKKRKFIENVPLETLSGLIKHEAFAHYRVSKGGSYGFYASSPSKECAGYVEMPFFEGKTLNTLSANLKIVQEEGGEEYRLSDFQWLLFIMTILTAIERLHNGEECAHGDISLKNQIVSWKKEGVETNLIDLARLVPPASDQLENAKKDDIRRIADRIQLLLSSNLKTSDLGDPPNQKAPDYEKIQSSSIKGKIADITNRLKEDAVPLSLTEALKEFEETKTDHLNENLDDTVSAEFKESLSSFLETHINRIQEKVDALSEDIKKTVQNDDSLEKKKLDIYKDLLGEESSLINWDAPTLYGLKNHIDTKPNFSRQDIQQIVGSLEKVTRNGRSQMKEKVDPHRTLVDRIKREIFQPIADWITSWLLKHDYKNVWKRPLSTANIMKNFTPDFFQQRPTLSKVIEDVRPLENSAAFYLACRI